MDEHRQHNNFYSGVPLFRCYKLKEILHAFKVFPLFGRYANLRSFSETFFHKKVFVKRNVDYAGRSLTESPLYLILANTFSHRVFFLSNKLMTNKTFKILSIKHLLCKPVFCNSIICCRFLENEN